MDEMELMRRLVSANIITNETDVSQVGEIMNRLIREKEMERKVLAILGEPGTVTKKERGIYYRYRKSLSKGIQKDIVRKTRSEVIKVAYDIIWDTKSKEMTVTEVFEEWYKIRTETKSYKTYRKDLSDWNSHLRDTDLASMPIAAVRAENVIETLQQICGDHTISRTSFNAVLTLLRGIWSKAVAMGIIDINVIKQMDFREMKTHTEQPKSDVQKQKDVYSPEEIKKLREYLLSKDNRNTYEQAILFHSYIGIRMGELRAISWDDYDPATSRLSLNHEIIKTKIGKRKYADLDVPHTKGYAAEGQREFFLPTPCREILEQMRGVNGDKHYVFNSRGKYPINPNHYNDHLKEICPLAGIRYFSSHKFRFRWITDAYDAGTKEISIQRIAGHSRPDMTRKYRRTAAETVSSEDMDRICGYTEKP